MERKIGIGSSSNPLINLTFLLILITYLVDTVLITIYCREKFCLGHSRELRELRTHTAKIQVVMKLGIDLSAIVLNYFDPSKHDFGEIHLHFEVVDKQFFYKF